MSGTGEQTLLNELIDVDSENITFKPPEFLTSPLDKLYSAIEQPKAVDNLSLWNLDRDQVEAVNESFINYLKEMGVFEKNADMDITNVLALKNLWQGAGSPYLQAEPQDYSAKYGGRYIDGFSGKYRDNYGVWSQVWEPDTVKARKHIDKLGGVGYYEHIDDRTNTMYEEEATLLNTLIQELSHAYQTQTSSIPADWSNEKYTTKGTSEYRAHSVIYPFLKHIYENEGGIVPDKPQDMEMFQFAREYMKDIK